MAKVRRCLLIPDIHVPYHCKKFVSLITKVLKSIVFDGVVQLGDFVDLPQLSKYPRDPNRTSNILDDIEKYRSMVCSWQGYLRSGATWHQLQGNHCHRLQTYTWTKCPEVDQIIRPMGDLLKIDSMPVKTIIHPYDVLKSCVIGDCILHHGFYYNEHTAATNVKRYPYNFIQGHTHRIQLCSTIDKYSATLGCGVDISKTTHKPLPVSWQHALGILYLNGDKTHLSICQVINGAAVIEGELIKS